MVECVDDIALAVELLCTLIKHDRIDDSDINVLISTLFSSIETVLRKTHSTS